MRLVKFVWTKVTMDESFINTTTMLVDDMSQIEDFLKLQEGWRGTYELYQNEDAIGPIILHTRRNRLTLTFLDKDHGMSM